MASIDTPMISDPKEHKWVVEIVEIFKHQLEIDVEAPSVSLFQVPETIAQKKQEAYEPQQIGLGPIHHFRPRPYKKMEQKKLGVMRKVLKDYNIKDYELHVLDNVRKIVPLVRSCYDMFLEHNDDVLARIFAIDGLFLHNLFHTYNSPIDEYLIFLKNKADERKRFLEEYRRNVLEEQSNEEADEEAIEVTVDNQAHWEKLLNVGHHDPEQLIKVGPKKRLVAQDVLMVENQIPFTVLKEIDDALHPSSSNNFSPSKFRVFCEVHSPLKLCSKSQAPSSVDHILHYMYYAIVNNVPVQKPEDQLFDDPWRSNVVMECYEEVITFISKIPQKEIVQAYEQTISMLETFSKKETRIIPSATKLHDKVGFQFHCLKEDEGIQKIDVIGLDIYLPVITLNNNSDVILRNLVAYETLTAGPDSFPLNEYMGLMCGLITNKDDASYLKSRNVITGDMGADEVAKLFIGISSSISTAKSKEKSKLRKVIDDINKVYERRLMMKAHLLMKKVARWVLEALKAIGSFVGFSWKIVVFVVSIVTVYLLTRQAFCDTFGCGAKTVTLLPYASS